jgi:hypothetical protein
MAGSVACGILFVAHLISVLLNALRQRSVAFDSADSIDTAIFGIGLLALVVLHRAISQTEYEQS